MPRRPRLDLPGVAQHIVQRGNDRQACFFTDADRLCYLGDLREIAVRLECRIHAYVLMTNHVHLLATPMHAGRIALMMQCLGRRYVRYFNDRHQRTGTLWEGRYKACPVDAGAPYLRCHRYIELNPVRAGMVAAPGDHPWSSYGAHANGRPDALLSAHPSYLALGATPAVRQAAHRALVAEVVAKEEVDAIRSHLSRQHAFGDERFRDAIERRSDRPAGPQRIGRPRKRRDGG